MIVLGLDPGYDGAGVALNSHHDIIYTFKYNLILNGRKMYDVRKIENHFLKVIDLRDQERVRPGKHKLIAVIEDQHRWPKLMMGFGVLWTLASLYADEVMLVAPRTWQAHYEIKGKRKQERASREVARAQLGLDTNDHNIAEAALIALWAARRKNHD